MTSHQPCALSGEEEGGATSLGLAPCGPNCLLGAELAPATHLDPGIPLACADPLPPQSPFSRPLFETSGFPSLGRGVGPLE